MSNLEENKLKMTVFYRKASGDIKMILGGINDMGALGDEQSDYGLIWDYIVVNRNESIMNNPLIFRVNVNTKKLELKGDIL